MKIYMGWWLYKNNQVKYTKVCGGRFYTYFSALINTFVLPNGLIPYIVFKVNDPLFVSYLVPAVLFHTSASFPDDLVDTVLLTESTSGVGGIDSLLETVENIFRWR